MAYAVGDKIRDKSTGKVGAVDEVKPDGSVHVRWDAADAGWFYPQYGMPSNLEKMSAAPSGTGATSMSVSAADLREGDRVQSTYNGPGVVTKLRPDGWITVRHDVGGTVSYPPERPNDLVKMSATGATRMTTMASPGQYVECPECGAPVQVNQKGDYPPHYMEGTHVYCTNSDKKAMSATGAARRMGENMKPEAMKKLGLAADADDAAKMAALRKFAADAPTKMGAMDPAACAAMADDLDMMSEWGDEASKPAMKALAKKFRKMAGPDEPDADDKEKAAEMTAMSAGYAAMQKKLAALEAAEKVRAEADAKTREQMFSALADDAVRGGFPAEARDALVITARADYPKAQAMAAPFIAKAHTLSTRVTGGTSSRTTATGPSVVERKATVAFGVDLAAAIKMHRAKNPGLSYEAAAMAVAKEQPALLDNYHNGVGA